jgi:hypothetical protein
MNIIERLPNDIIFHIYVNILKHAKLRSSRNGEKVWVSQLDMSKYEHLNSVLRVLEEINEHTRYDAESESIVHDTYYIYRIKRHETASIEHIRQHELVDDDKLIMRLTQPASNASDTLKCRLSMRILKKKTGHKDMFKKENTLLFYKGDMIDYYWEFISFEFFIQ